MRSSGCCGCTCECGSRDEGGLASENAATVDAGGSGWTGMDDVDTGADVDADADVEAEDGAARVWIGAVASTGD